MDPNDQQQEVLWTYRWEIQPATPGIAAWLVDDDGVTESVGPTFLAFQVRDASVRTFASVPKFASGGRRGGQLKFAEPPEHFLEVTGGENGLWSQEVFAFLPAALPSSERMPWFRVGVHVFFIEDEAHAIAEERRAAIGTEVMVAHAGAGAGTGDGGSGGPGFDHGSD
ncbi:MAG: hypothetical protein P8R42_23610 [Candidatus Binatia bacterium]|nr:hypothetical protein [Candidatus Binatia bacterium]